MRRAMRVFLPLLMLILGTSCGSIFGSDAGEVQARWLPDSLLLENNRSAPIYYFAIERGIAATVDWVPCSNPVLCKGVAAGAKQVIPAAEVMNWEDAEEVLVYWWHLVPDGSGGFEVEHMRSLIVEVAT